MVARTIHHRSVPHLDGLGERCLSRSSLGVMRMTNRPKLAHSSGRLRRAEIRAGVLFASPWMAGFLLFTLGPLVASIWLSMTQYDVLTPPRFVGLDNYRNIILADRLFYKSLYNTLYITVFGVPANILMGLGIAMLLNLKVKGMHFYRTIYYLPSIVPTVASAILWMWLLNPQFGLINAALSLLGISGPAWLSSETWSKPSIILMGLWGAGGSMVIYLAGLKGIPEQLYEAAEIDGAGIWAKFFKITLPMLTPTLFFNLIMGIIGHLQIFAQAYIMTGGGPVDSTLFYVYYLFNNAFAYFKMGYASALAWILFLIILVITLIQFHFANRWVYYEGAERG